MAAFKDANVAFLVESPHPSSTVSPRRYCADGDDLILRHAAIGSAMQAVLDPREWSAL